MSQSVFAVARWEFNRFFKWRDQLIGVISLIVGAFIGFGAISFARSSNRIELATVGDSAGLKLADDSNIHITPSDESMDVLRDKVETKEIDGVLLFPTQAGGDPSNPIELVVRNQPSWIAELQLALDQLKLQREIRNATISESQLAMLLTPQSLQVVSINKHAVTRSDRIVAISMLIAMVLVSWLGLAYFMTGITGEKQQRVTEQIVSAISPQAWIDGKLIGLTSAAFASVASMIATGIATYFISALMGYRIELPSSMYRWDLLPWLTILFVGGAVFWNCFYAAVSSIINDPNTSARSSMLFLPLLPMVASFFAIPQPDGIAMRILSIVPGSSSTAMAIRLLLGDVAWWELATSVLMLIAGIAILRVIAGRIFAAGIMLYGKEPSWIDIGRWVLTDHAN